MVQITADINHIEKVIKRVKKAQNFTHSKVSELTRRIALLGGEVSTEGFNNAFYEGVNDVTVDVLMIQENEWVITAQGEAVAFIEFGTGVVNNTGYPIQDISKTGVPATPRSWSLSERGAGYLRDNDYWYLPKGLAEQLGKTGQKIYGNPPARAMYDACKEMREQLLEIAKEVYG